VLSGAPLGALARYAQIIGGPGDPTTQKLNNYCRRELKMAFYLYKKTNEKTYQRIRQIRLAGRNSIYNLWLKKGKPIDAGWEITNCELLSDITGQNDPAAFKVVIDFYPGSLDRIELVELLDLHIYSYPNGDKLPSWSVMMLRLRDFHKIYHGKEIELTERDKLLENIICDKTYEENIFEFLYLQGEEKGWAPGRVGFVNAAFIHKKAREYFKRWFCK